MRRRVFRPLILSFILLLLLMGLPSFALATSTAQESTDTVTAVTIPPRMNVRSGPATTYRVLGSISAGTEVTIIGENTDGRWARVQIDGYDGPAWLAKWLLDIQRNTGEESSTDATSAASPSEAVTTTGTTTDTIPVSTAVVLSATAQIIPTPTTAPVTTTASITTTTSITTAAPTPASSETPAVEEEAEATVEAAAEVTIDTSAGPVAVTTPPRMNVRRGPGTDYPIATGVDTGTQARIVA
ncbi:MAG: SH3 domain-containing protein, partial [Caldilineaceae bacterium]